jgi:hypothetical protein
MSNPFIWMDDEDLEESACYEAGGLFPTELGDLLGAEGVDPRRYRITAKLGYGAYSTVWMAHDLVAKCVAQALDAQGISIELSQHQRGHEDCPGKRFVNQPRGSHPGTSSLTLI